MIRFGFASLVVALVGSSLFADEKTGIDFQRDIQPILRDRCYVCHDSRKNSAELRLDVRSRAMKGGESGTPAIVPGSANQSELITRVSSTDKDVVMPPEGNKLSAAQIKLFRQWIDSGASWPDALANEGGDTKHWA